MPKNVKKGTLWDLLTNIQLPNVKKLEGAPFSDITKNFEKLHSAEKKSKGFVRYLKRVKNERGDPLH